MDTDKVSCSDFYYFTAILVLIKSTVVPPLAIKTLCYPVKKEEKQKRAKTKTKKLCASRIVCQIVKAK